MPHDPSQPRTARSRACARRAARGFTITELLVSLAMAAILTTLAAPSFNSMIAAQRARTFAADLYVAIAKTRADAVSLNQNVTLQPNAGGFANGWQILDVNANVLDNHAAATGVTVGAVAAVTYRASGRLPVGAAVPVFVITTGSGATLNHQCVSVDLGGRPYMKAAAAC